MNSEFVLRVARANWHVLLVMTGIICFAVYQAANETGEPAATYAPATATHVANIKPATATADVVAEERSSRRELAMATIREHEAAIHASHDPEKLAAYMNGIANLYFQKLQDYEAAAGYYERVLSEHSDAPNAYQTYVQLALCYQRLDQPEKRMTVLRRMLAQYPQDSQEYAYAHIELYGALPGGGPLAADMPSGSSPVELARVRQ